MTVQPTVYTPNDWADDRSGFAGEVRDSSAVPLFGFDEALEAA